MNTPDPRLRIITQAITRLIPRAVTGNVAVCLEEIEKRTGQPVLRHEWLGTPDAVAAAVVTALDTPTADQSPLAQAEDAKRARDLSGEIGALTAGYEALESAPWYPALVGDVLHVRYDATGGLPEFGETYVVEDSEEQGGLVLRLLSHTAKDTDDVGWFAHGVIGVPLLEPWMEAGPAALTIVRHGRVLHAGGVR